jgi:hypothetical protein
MSSLLEQAIIDATALREAALKNAEAAIVEKYAPEIKSAVASLLEAEHEEMEMDAEIAPEPEDVDAPPAYEEGESTCPCPPPGEEVELELNLDDLKEMAQELAPPLEEDFVEREELAETATPAALDEEEKLNMVDHDDDPETPEVPDFAADGKGDKDLAKESVEEDFILDEAAIAALVEELVVDITPQKSGWAGMPESTMQHNLELELAHRAATEVKEDNKALQKAIEELSESNTNLKKSNKTLKETVLKMKGAFDELSTSNAKLLYTNRILSSPSLNERQKEKIVEAISKAGSVDEAKVIYETLQSTGGTTSRRRQMPKSLSEAIQRSSSTVLPRRQPERTTDTAIDRLQILAGIKNNN